MLGYGQFHERDENQSLIASSTMESEFVVYFDATNQVLWLQNFIAGLGVVDSITKLLKIYWNDSAVIFFSNNGKYSKVSKHIKAKDLVLENEFINNKCQLK